MRPNSWCRSGPARSCSARRRSRGRAYTLPQLYVVNTGTEASRYAIRVMRLAKGAQRVVPRGWVDLPSSAIALAAGASTSVPLRLVVPAGATSGEYRTNLVAGTESAAGGFGTSLGAAAATQLRFAVAVGDAGFPWPWPSWVDALLIGGTLAAALAVLVRRAGLRLHVERRR